MLHIVQNPVIWAVLLAIITAIWSKKKIDTYLKIVYLAIEAIEISDNEIKTYVPKNIKDKLTSIKEYIAKRITGQADATLDSILDEKGYLNQKDKI